jgi:uncharacterized membrane protein
MPPARVSPVWWIAVVLFGFLGAFVAWFVNRRSNPAGAKPFLIVGIVLLVVGVLAAAAFAFGGLALISGLG